MNALNKPQVQKSEQNNWFNDWIDSLEEHHLRMSQDEAYRSQIAAKATNTGNTIAQQAVAERLEYESKLAKGEIPF